MMVAEQYEHNALSLSAFMSSYVLNFFCVKLLSPGHVQISKPNYYVTKKTSVAKSVSSPLKPKLDPFESTPVSLK